MQTGSRRSGCRPRDLGSCVTSWEWLTKLDVPAGRRLEERDRTLFFPRWRVRAPSIRQVLDPELLPHRRALSRARCPVVLVGVQNQRQEILRTRRETKQEGCLGANQGLYDGDPSVRPLAMRC